MMMSLSDVVQGHDAEDVGTTFIITTSSIQQQPEDMNNFSGDFSDISFSSREGEGNNPDPMDPSDIPEEEFTTSDYYETNPQILKAELSFYSTPHTKDYEEAVYGTLKNIEMTCVDDYSTICAPTIEPSSDMISNGALVMDVPDFLSAMGINMFSSDESFSRKRSLLEDARSFLIAPVASSRRALSQVATPAARKRLVCHDCFDYFDPFHCFC